jgi:hypothetical protein
MIEACGGILVFFPLKICICGNKQGPSVTLATGQSYILTYITISPYPAQLHPNQAHFWFYWASEACYRLMNSSKLKLNIFNFYTLHILVLLRI